MNATTQAGTRATWLLVAAATLTLMVTMGVRQSLGLFVQPIARDTALGIVEISFALAVAQLVWGIMREESAFQPRVESYAHAIGLMQLLESTAESHARRAFGLSVDAQSLREPATINRPSSQQPIDGGPTNPYGGTAAGREPQ